MKKIIWGLCLLTILSTRPVLGAVAQLPSVGTSAQMIGIGYIEGFNNTALTVFENPASLYYLNGKSFASFYSEAIENQVQFNSMAFAMPISFGKATKFGIGYLENKIPNQFATALDSNNEVKIDHVFEYRNSVLTTSLSGDYSTRTHWGISTSYYSSAMDTLSGSGYGMDVGLLFNRNRFDFSLTAKNLLASNKKYTDTNTTFAETLQRRLVSSGQYSLNDRTRLYGQLNLRDGQKALVAAGVKYYPIKKLYTSLGYGNFEVAGISRTRTNLGLGVEFQSIQLYFAYENTDDYSQSGQYFFSINLNL